MRISGKKSHKIKVRINNIIKRNVEGKTDEIYGLDTTVVTVDLNRLRKGNKIKQQIFDAEFMILLKVLKLDI